MADQAMEQVAKDNTMWLALVRYISTEHYTNTHKWATVPQHTKGSLWAAFIEGFKAGSDSLEPADPPAQTPDRPAPPQRAEEPTCPSENCRYCSGEWCAKHTALHQECDCDVIDRHPAQPPAAGEGRGR